MSVVVETTLGDITIDLFVKQRPRACLNFLKLCKIKYYNYNLFHTIRRGFIAQTGDPTGSRNGGESIFGVLQGPLKRYFEAEKNPRIKHTTMGVVSFVGEDQMIGSQFFITLGTDLSYLDEQHCVFGEVVEGVDVLELLNEAICDQDNRPYQDVRITHTVILDDPFPDPNNLRVPSRSPSPNAERMQGGRIAPDEEIDETDGKTAQEVGELVAEREAKARATILEMVGDIPDAEMAPPENVLFVCKLNPVTTDDDLEIIFSRFGKIKSCEVIRDKKTDDSLQYAFVEFEERKSCEDAYFKMDNVLIDDRRIHVDFSQSVAKVKWHGKGRGVTIYDDKGRKNNDARNDIGNGNYKRSNGDHGSKTNRRIDENSRVRNKDYYSDTYFRESSKQRSPSRERRTSYGRYASESRYRNERRHSTERTSRERYRENGRERYSDKHYRTERYREDERTGNKKEHSTRPYGGNKYSREKFVEPASDGDATYKSSHKEKRSGHTSKGNSKKKCNSSTDDSTDSDDEVIKKKKHVRDDSSGDESCKKKKKKKKHKRRDSGSEDEKRTHKKHKKKKRESSSEDT